MKPGQAPSLLARGLEPFVAALWMFFLVWTAILAALWWVGDDQLAAIPYADLRAALVLVAKSADVLWLVLAAANLYLFLAEREGLGRSRLFAASIIIVAGVIAACSAWTGYPLGSVVYTTARLGPKFGPVPLGWLMLWVVVVLGGREFAARIFPRASHNTLAVATGILALITDLNLEPIATNFRFYWFWHLSGNPLPAPVPWRNYAVWGIAAGLLAWTMRERTAASFRPVSWRPVLVLVIVNGVLILGHLRMLLAH